MRSYRLVLLFVLLPLLGSAQFKNLLNHLAEIDSTYLVSYRNDVTARFYFVSEEINFGVHPPSGDHMLIYKPNNDLKIGFDVFHKWWRIGLAVNNPFAGNDREEKGSSSIIDIRLNAYGNALALDLSIQDQSGFFLKNMEEIYPGWNLGDEFPPWNPGDEYPQRSDMHIFSLGAIVYYIHNYKKHSFKGAFIHNERQLKSSGSFIVSPSFVYLKMSSNYTLIPLFYTDAYNIPEDEQLQSGKFLTFGISAGYSYTYVLNKSFYVSLSFIPGVFLQSYKYETYAQTIKGSNPTFLWTGRSAIGYNGTKFYLGLGGIWGFKNTRLDIGQSNFNYDMNQIRLWIGTRFNVPRKR